MSGKSCSSCKFHPYPKGSFCCPKNNRDQCGGTDPSVLNFQHNLWEAKELYKEPLSVTSLNERACSKCEYGGKGYCVHNIAKACLAGRLRYYNFISKQKKGAEPMEPIKIFGGEVKPKKVERFIKVSDNGDHILIHLVDKFGKNISSGSLLRMSKKDGKIHLYTHVNNGVGLALDDKRRLIIE